MHGEVISRIWYQASAANSAVPASLQKNGVDPGTSSWWVNHAWSAGSSALRLILALTLEELGVAPHEWEATCGKVGRSTKRLARSGQLAAWLAHRNTSMSIVGIGRKLGRNHTTVLYALKRMPEILATEPDIARAAKRIEERLERLAALGADSAEARILLAHPGTDASGGGGAMTFQQWDQEIGLDHGPAS
jgi:Bacterial dnaA protein helix-turn-helix